MPLSAVAPFVCGSLRPGDAASLFVALAASPGSAARYAVTPAAAKLSMDQWAAIARTNGFPALYQHLHAVALALSYAAAAGAADPLVVHALAPSSPMIDGVLLLLSR